MIVLLTGWPEEVKTLFSGTITWLVWMLRQIGKGEQPTRTQLLHQTYYCQHVVYDTDHLKLSIQTVTYSFHRPY